MCFIDFMSTLIYVYHLCVSFKFYFVFFQNNSSMGHYKDFHGEVSTKCWPLISSYSLSNSSFWYWLGTFEVNVCTTTLYGNPCSNPLSLLWGRFLCLYVSCKISIWFFNFFSERFINGSLQGFPWGGKYKMLSSKILE